jgi:hypothetical protein
MGAGRSLSAAPLAPQRHVAPGSGAKDRGVNALWQSIISGFRSQAGRTRNCGERLSKGGIESGRPVLETATEIEMFRTGSCSNNKREMLVSPTSTRQPDFEAELAALNEH